MHISLPRTPVIYNKMCTSLSRPYPSVRPSADSPLVHTAATPDPTDAAAARTDAAAGKTGTPTEYPATAHPTSTTCGQPSVATTPNVGAPFMTPVARQGETTGGPNTPAAAHPTSTTYGQPSVTTTPNVGAPFMTPVARQGETTGEPNTPATTRPRPRDCP